MLDLLVLGGIGGGLVGLVMMVNGVVYVCLLDVSGCMYVFDGVNGVILWSYLSGGFCLLGVVIVDGMFYWGLGYGNFGFGMLNSKLYVFIVFD